MTRTVTIRRFVCALAALSVCAPMIAIAAPPVRSDRPAEFRAVAAPPSIVLLGRADGRQDHARRLSRPFFVIPVPRRGGEPDLVRVAAATKRYAPRCLFTAGPRTGRSPPAIS